MSAVALSEGQQVVLTLASDLAAPRQAHFPLDRIRLQKAVFLVTRRGPERWVDMYTYRPYDWGPYSDDLTSDITKLRATGLIRLRETNHRHAAHAVSPKGAEIAHEHWRTLEVSEQTFLCAVRAYVTNRSFSDLLREVYAAYPQYATKSRFSG